MRTHSLIQVAVLSGLLALTGCASKVTQPEKYSGFLKDYSNLQQATSASGKPVLRWVDPSFDDSKYDSIVYNPPSPTIRSPDRRLRLARRPLMAC